jgi:hypothetical protein
MRSQEVLNQKIGELVRPIEIDEWKEYLVRLKNDLHDAHEIQTCDVDPDVIPAAEDIQCDATHWFACNHPAIYATVEDAFRKMTDALTLDSTVKNVNAAISDLQRWSINGIYRARADKERTTKAVLRAYNRIYDMDEHCCPAQKVINAHSYAMSMKSMMSR